MRSSSAPTPSLTCRFSTKRALPPIAALLLGLAVVSLATAAPVQRPNILFIAVDDLRNDLGALGVAHAKTPNLDGLAAEARLFSHHYVQVPTCGASRCALLRGKYPDQRVHVGNNAIRDTQGDWGKRSLPTWLREHGYRTLALGKIGHYPGGLTGKGWAEGRVELPGAWQNNWIPDSPWKTAESMMHAYANGKSRTPGKTPPLEAFEGPDEAYPDAWVARDATEVLHRLARSDGPWLFAVGFFKPHLPFTAPKKWHDMHDSRRIAVPPVTARPPEPSGWHRSGEFRSNYDSGGLDPDKDPAYAARVRQAYAAATSYVDAQVGRVLGTLKTLGLDRNTIVVVWGDHGFLLGEHGIWGKHCLYENAIRSPLIIRAPGMKDPGRKSDAIVETVDIFPTLIDLCGLPPPAGLDGRSLRPQLDNPGAPSRKPAHGFWNDAQRSIRTPEWRLIIHPTKGGPDGGIELFDMRADPNEARNVASREPGTVKRLLAQLDLVPDHFAAPAVRE